MTATMLGCMIEEEVSYSGLEYYFIKLTYWTLTLQALPLPPHCHYLMPVAR